MTFIWIALGIGGWWLSGVFGFFFTTRSEVKKIHDKHEYDEYINDFIISFGEIMSMSWIGAIVWVYIIFFGIRDYMSDRKILRQFAKLIAGNYKAYDKNISEEE